MNRIFYGLLVFMSFVCSNKIQTTPQDLYNSMGACYKREHDKLVKMVDELKQNKNVFTKKELNEALVNAAHYSTLEVAKAFMQAGADVNYVQSCSSAIMYAAFHNKVDMVQEFIRAGGDVNYYHPFTKTALFQAIEGDALEVVQELIKAGIDVNREDGFGRRALLKAVGNNQINIVRKLLTVENIIIDFEVIQEAQETSKEMFKVFEPFIKKIQHLD